MRFVIGAVVVALLLVSMVHAARQEWGPGTWYLVMATFNYLTFLHPPRED